MRRRAQEARYLAAGVIAGHVLSAEVLPHHFVPVNRPDQRAQGSLIDHVRMGRIRQGHVQGLRQVRALAPVATGDRDVHEVRGHVQRAGVRQTQVRDDGLEVRAEVLAVKAQAEVRSGLAVERQPESPRADRRLRRDLGGERRTGTSTDQAEPGDGDACTDHQLGTNDHEKDSLRLS